MFRFVSSFLIDKDFELQLIVTPVSGGSAEAANQVREKIVGSGGVAKTFAGLIIFRASVVNRNHFI